MRKYIMIACGGFLGAVMRYSIRGIRIFPFGEIPALNILVINLSGAFLLAWILTVCFVAFACDSDIRQGITTGLLGAFTTFSTLCKETVGFLREGNCFLAAAYIFLSAVLGLGMVYFGILLAEKGVRRKNISESADISETERDVE